MNETAFDRLRDALARHGSRIEDKSQNNFMAQCPAHEDRNPSLNVTSIEGQALAHCFAGCTNDAVLAAIGWEPRGLFDSLKGADYRYDDGRIVHRSPNKKFSQSGDLKGTPQLYRSRKVARAVMAGERVFLVEGEKDVHALESLGAVATTAPMGASSFGRSDVSPLQDANVVAVVDDDESGRKWAAKVASKLEGVARSIEFAKAGSGKDAADHVAAGLGLDEFVSEDHGAADESTSQTSHDSENSPGEVEKKSASTQLVEIALERYDFGVSDSGDAFAMPKRGPKVVGMLRGGKTSLRGLLAREYFVKHKKAPPQQALADALLVIEGFAAEADEERLYQRVAAHAGALWLDLGDTEGHAVEITGNGWKVADPPVKFKRTTLNSPLPEPVSGGDLADLWEWLNVAEADRPLVLAWLVAVIFCDIPHPVLGLFGEQGTGKSTAEKLLVSLVDPSPVPLRQPPRDKDSWVTAAAGSWVVGIDNLSGVPDWLSDTICRAVTGDGDVRRKLYTDGDHSVFSFRRCVILNGIDLGALAGDLGDRMLPIELRRISDVSRREETEMWPQWARVHPGLLGALLDLVTSVKAALPFVELPSKPRMADFARILAAVDKVNGSNGLRRYMSKQATAAKDALTADVFAVRISEVITSTFTGSSAELLAKLTPEDPEWRAPKRWPGNARAVTQRLKRQAPVMRKAGWEVSDDDGRNESNAVRWTITPPEKSGKPSSFDSSDSSSQVKADESTSLANSSLARDNSSDSSDSSEGKAMTSRYEPTSQTRQESRPSPTAHMWWPARRTGEHGRDCTQCRRSPGGPDFIQETSR